MSNVMPKIDGLSEYTIQKKVRAAKIEKYVTAPTEEYCYEFMGTVHLVGGVTIKISGWMSTPNPGDYLVQYDHGTVIWTSAHVFEKVYKLTVEKPIALSDNKQTIACPFCGGLPEITKHYKDDMFKLRHWCPIVGALYFDWKNSRDQVITTWNTRKEPIECNSIPNKPPKKLG